MHLATTTRIRLPASQLACRGDRAPLVRPCGALVPRRAAVRVCATADAKTTPPGSKKPATPASPQEAVEAGLAAFRDRKDYGEAVRLFRAAIDAQPGKASETAAAAWFNLGCAYAKQRKFGEAAEAIGTAINDHNLKLAVALTDPDLRELRDSREWLDMLSTVRGGMTREQKVNLRAEAKAPFRFARITILGGLAVGAALGLVVILGRVALSLKGGPDAPELQESLTNLGINGAALAVLSFLVGRDVQEQEKVKRRTEREEGLSRLLIKLSGASRVLPLIRFRGAVRPVIIAGDKSYVERCIREGEVKQADLRQRGVSVVPVIYTSREDPEERLAALKRSMQQDSGAAGAKGFGSSGSSSSGSSGGGQPREAGESGSGIGNSEVSLTEADRKWRLEPTALEEWEAWIEAQKEFAGLDQAKRNVWVQVQLDGTVRSSGSGTPPWERFIGDLPPLDSVRTQMTDGIGPSI